MEVTYRTTAEDFIAFSRYSAFRTRTSSATVSYYIKWIVPPLVVFLVLKRLEVEVWLQAVIMLGTILYIALYPPLARIIFNVYLRDLAREVGNRGVIGKITLIITDDTFVEVTRTTRTEVRWDDILRVDVVGDYTFIFVTALSAAIIPRRGFDSEQDYEAVRDFALARLRRSLEDRPPSLEASQGVTVQDTQSEVTAKSPNEEK